MGGLQIIGQRLVRTFGEGDKLRTVVTQTLKEGKTFTQVLDKDGQIIKERLKVIKPMEKVGDKFVRTMTKVNQNGRKIINDVVFNQQGERIGQRIEMYDNQSRRYKKLLDGNKNGTYTRYDRSFGVFDKTAIKELDHGHVEYMTKSLTYNNKNLPTPNMLNIDLCNFNNKSMLEMRQWLQKRFPQRTYFDGFPHYNKTIDENVLGNVTGLDKYL